MKIFLTIILSILPYFASAAGMEIYRMSCLNGADLLDIGALTTQDVFRDYTDDLKAKDYIHQEWGAKKIYSETCIVADREVKVAFDFFNMTGSGRDFGTTLTITINGKIVINDQPFIFALQTEGITSMYINEYVIYVCVAKETTYPLSVGGCKSIDIRKALEDEKPISVEGILAEVGS